MSREKPRISDTATRLRQVFDETFAAPPASLTAAGEDVLFIRIGGDPFAFRLAEAAGLHVKRSIVPTPSPTPELLGVTALRGQLTAIYDLGAFLGYRDRNTPRWFVLVRGLKAVGLAFEVLEAHARVPQACIGAGGSEPLRAHVRGSVQFGGSFRPLIHIASVVEAIASRASHTTPSNER